jgi:Domain of unknown function (DUF4390)
MGRVRHQPGRPTLVPDLRFVRGLQRVAAVVVWCAIALGCTEALAAESARITNLTVKTNRERVIVSASLVQGLPADVGDELQHGIGKTLYYYVVLKRHVPLWMDEELDSSTVRFRIWYDLVKRQFVVAQRREGSEIRQTADRLEDVNRLISHIHDVTIPFTAPPRRSGTYYYISVRAEMRSAKLPVYLEYFFFFLPVAQISTPWTDSPPLPVETAARP